MQKPRTPPLLLIGGTSHTGKSTLAEAVGQHRGWEVRSTDKLARHPGRPWQVGDRPVPPHVVEHYGSLTAPELLEDVLAHYRRNVFPQVLEIVREQQHQPAPPGLVLEGSALWPEFVAESALLRQAKTLWLHAPDVAIEARILTNSQFATRTEPEQRLIRRFSERSILYNQQMLDHAQRLALPVVRMDEESSAEDLLTRLIEWVKE